MHSVDTSNGAEAHRRHSVRPVHFGLAYCMYSDLM